MAWMSDLPVFYIILKNDGYHLLFFCVFIIMNQFFIGSYILASGQPGGFSGDFKNISRGRNCLFTVYTSGAEA